MLQSASAVARQLRHKAPQRPRTLLYKLQPCKGHGSTDDLQSPRLPRFDFKKQKVVPHESARTFKLGVPRHGDWINTSRTHDPADRHLAIQSSHASLMAACFQVSLPARSFHCPSCWQTRCKRPFQAQVFQEVHSNRFFRCSSSHVRRRC